MKKKSFSEQVIAWQKLDGRNHLPWQKNPSKYRVWVSEIMLQQTQVVTVLDRGFYRRWLEVFPDFKQLAEAEESEVLRMWEGLGYYSRARNLHKLAKIVVYELENHFPKDVEQIEALPGIGKYTAGAIASFAFDSPVPAVDANIARVLARIFDFQERIDTSVGKKQIWEWAADLVPSSGGRIWNSALMELGQTLCGPRKTFCNECPIAESCRCVEPLGLPIKKLKQGVTNIDEHVILNIRNGKVLLEQETGNRRKGMWKLPSRDKKEVTKLDLITTQNYGITRYKVKMHIYKSKNAQLNENEKWVSLDELASLPVPSPYRRALELITKV